MNEFDKIFDEIWKKWTLNSPMLQLSNVTPEVLNRYKQIIKKVKQKYKGNLKTEYNIENQTLSVSGDNLDIYWFGYYSKKLENET